MHYSQIVSPLLAAAVVLSSSFGHSGQPSDGDSPGPKVAESDSAPFRRPDSSPQAEKPRVRKQGWDLRSLDVPLGVHAGRQEAATVANHLESDAAGEAQPVGRAERPDFSEPLLIDAYPNRLQARLERHRQQVLRAVGPGPSLSLVLQHANKWLPGQEIKVAFRGGDSQLHKQIANAASKWTMPVRANLQLDFGDSRNGTFRSWSPTDAQYVAHIRISFDQSGYWSLVGTDSSAPDIVGPGEASMNLEGFHTSLPADWEATTLHEFGHALGAHHEHQHPTGGCDSEFRWHDDPGYIPTTDQFGQFIPDEKGRRPGIYTVLGGPPNEWPRWKVDHNLRQIGPEDAFEMTAYDPTSIMKYHFPAWMFRDGSASHCFSQRNHDLSPIDIEGIRAAYPAAPKQVAERIEERKAALSALLQTDLLNETTKYRPMQQFNLIGEE